LAIWHPGPRRLRAAAGRRDARPGITFGGVPAEQGGGPADSVVRVRVLAMAVRRRASLRLWPVLKTAVFGTRGPSGARRLRRSGYSRPAADQSGNLASLTMHLARHSQRCPITAISSGRQATRTLPVRRSLDSVRLRLIHSASEGGAPRAIGVAVRLIRLWVWRRPGDRQPLRGGHVSTAVAIPSALVFMQQPSRPREHHG
jgi:hypothetical protein